MTKILLGDQRMSGLAELSDRVLGETDGSKILNGGWLELINGREK